MAVKPQTMAAAAVVAPVTAPPESDAVVPEGVAASGLLLHSVAESAIMQEECALPERGEISQMLQSAAASPELLRPEPGSEPRLADVSPPRIRDVFGAADGLSDSDLDAGRRTGRVRRRLRRLGGSEDVAAEAESDGSAEPETPSVDVIGSGSPPAARRRGAAAARVLSDSDEEDEGGVSGEGARGGTAPSPSVGGEGSSGDGGDEGEGEGEHELPGMEELNQQTQSALREIGCKARVGGAFQPSINPMQSVLEKLRRRQKEAGERAPKVHVEFAKQTPLSIQSVDALLDQLPFADDEDDLMIDDEPPADENCGAGVTAVASTEEAEEEPEPAPTIFLAYGRSQKGSRARQVTSAELEKLDLATADRVPAQFSVAKEEGIEEEDEDGSDYEEEDYEAMEYGCESDEQPESAGEEGEQGPEEEQSDVVAGDVQNEGRSVSDEIADDAESEGEEDVDAQAPTQRRAIVLDAVSDDEEDFPREDIQIVEQEIDEHAPAGPKQFVEMEAEMSDDEGHEGDDEDDEDDDGVLKDLIGTAEEGQHDETVRAKLHARWEAERDRDELNRAMMARKHGYKRGVNDYEEEDEERAARRRRAAQEEDEPGACQIETVVDLDIIDSDDEKLPTPHKASIAIDLTGLSGLDATLEDDLIQGSQDFLKVLERADSRMLPLPSEGVARHAGQRFKTVSRMGVFDVSNHEMSNHATFLGRTSSIPSGSIRSGSGGGGGKSTFTFTTGKPELTQSLSDHATPASQPSEYLQVVDLTATRSGSGGPTSFAGLLPKKGNKKPPGSKESQLVTMLGQQNNDCAKTQSVLANFDLAKVLKSKLSSAR